MTPPRPAKELGVKTRNQIGALVDDHARIGSTQVKHYAASFPGVYLWDDTEPLAHPWFPTYNAKVYKNSQEVAKLNEWEGVSGIRSPSTLNSVD